MKTHFTISPKYLNFYCWTYFSGLIFIFLSLGLIKLIVFFLFLFLINDLFINHLGHRFSNLNKRTIFYVTNTLIVILATLLLLTVIPKFIKDLPNYTEKIQETINQQYSYFIYYIQYNFGLDLEINGLREKFFTWVKENLRQTFNIIQVIGKNLFTFALAVIINFIVYHNMLSNKTVSNSEDQDSLWACLIQFSLEKMNVFYKHFKTVMSAQLIISSVNTVLTVFILFALDIPYKTTLLVLVFIFGLLPVVGNLISNTIICFTAFVWGGLWQVLMALIFLVTIHKLEYFLNSKIIGRITSLPFYVILLALIVGELLFNVSGMIVAIPTVLFIREELKLLHVRKGVDLEQKNLCNISK